MHHEISHGPSFALLRVDLEPGETLTAEAGAMVARHQQTAMEVSLNASNSTSFVTWIASLFVALVRKFLGGETFFVNRFTAPERGSVWIAPALSGHITHRSLKGETLILSTGAYLAHSGSLQVNMKFGGVRGILAKEGLFFLEFTGHGDLWFTSYGGIEVIEVSRPMMIDNGHLVGIFTWVDALNAMNELLETRLKH